MWMNPNTTASHNIDSNNTIAQHLYSNNYSKRIAQPPAHPSLYANTTESDAYLDIDSDIRSQTSTSSSPSSTAGSFPLSTFDSLPPSRNSRTFQQQQIFPPVSDMMYTDTWSGDINQFALKNHARNTHNRDDSLSSLGSLGPASPFSFSSANPQIAVHDSNDYQTLQIQDDHSYQLAAKAPNGTSHDTFYASYPYSSDNTSVQAYASMLAPQRHRADRVAGGLLPPPDFSTGASRPGSVASSVVSDSPATPAAPEPAEAEQVRRRKNAASTAPKLDRTMTDIFGDELYNPNFQFTSAPPSQPSQSVASPTNELFAQRLQAANNQHLNATTTTAPASSIHRGRSPFRNGSPLAPKPNQEFSPQVASHNMRFNTTQQLRERRKQEETAQALRQIAQSTSTGTPQTISPKDAVLEFNDDDSNNFPLLPQQQSSGFDTSQMDKATSQASNFSNLGLDTSFDTYLTSQLSASQLSNNGVQLPQQYPFVSKQRQQPNLPSATSSLFPSQVESSASPSSAASSPQRPEHVGADGGTYTCTYHGCTQRFETPALLQKHKREGHRQAHGLNGLRRPEVSPTSDFFNTQAGPHKCERINPSTGKPCNTIFSRPYDLTRHEDTIHNGRKQKVRCDVCTEEKTFSRADALTRHYRVCHPDLEFPGKHRKRGGLAN
ncbi:unnamed protein product [Discula destructiva]